MPQKYRVRNWSTYNISLKHRGDVFFHIDKAILENGWYFDGVRKPGGAVRYSDALIEMMLMIQHVYHLPLRQLQGFVGSIVGELGLNASVPDYTTISRRAAKASLKIKLFQTLCQAGPLHVVFDSTGLSIYSASPKHVSRYSQDRLQKKASAWKKLHIAFDLDTSQAISSKFTPSNVPDHQAVEELLSKVGPKIETVRADRAYDRRICYQALHARDIKAIIPPTRKAKKQGVRSKDNVYEAALKSRDDAIDFIRQHQDYDEGSRAWKISEDYHDRSRVEALFHRFKRAFGYSLRGKTNETQQTETIIKLSLLNKFIRYDKGGFVKAD